MYDGNEFSFGEKLENVLFTTVSEIRMLKNKEIIGLKSMFGNDICQKIKLIIILSKIQTVTVLFCQISFVISSFLIVVVRGYLAIIEMRKVY